MASKINRTRSGTSTTAPAGFVDVDIVADSRTADVILKGLDQAFEPFRLAYNFLQDHVDPILRERVEERFASEGDELSGAWPSLKPFTQDMREAGGFGPAHPINVRTGAMKSHLLDRPPDVQPNTLGATMWSPGRGGSGETLEKVRVAQQGDANTRTVPRPVLGVGMKDMELILIHLGIHIAEFQPGGGQGLLTP